MNNVEISLYMLPLELYNLYISNKLTKGSIIEFLDKNYNIWTEIIYICEKIKINIEYISKGKYSLYPITPSYKRINNNNIPCNKQLMYYLFSNNNIFKYIGNISIGYMSYIKNNNIKKSKGIPICPTKKECDDKIKENVFDDDIFLKYNNFSSENNINNIYLSNIIEKTKKVTSTISLFINIISDIKIEITNNEGYILIDSKDINIISEDKYKFQRNVNLQYLYTLLKNFNISKNTNNMSIKLNNNIYNFEILYIQLIFKKYFKFNIKLLNKFNNIKNKFYNNVFMWIDDINVPTKQVISLNSSQYNIISRLQKQ